MVLSKEESSLFSAESVTFAFNELMSSFKESANKAEVLGNSEVISMKTSYHLKPKLMQLYLILLTFHNNTKN